ncbi:MAG: exonuclease domain-containing protein, partial [Clostridia bacterium]|nr:exonuclease domain-containing protein [Clostridia bacterium]
MQYIILDLEWNTAFDKRRKEFVNEIIEFGAVKLDGRLEEVGTFSSFVKPVIEKKLTSRVRKLTHITNEDVQNAEKYLPVTNHFTDWIGEDPDTIFMSWGDMDIRALISNNGSAFDNVRIPYIHHYVDLQDCFMKQKGLPKAHQVGLSTAAEMIDVDPETFALHRALDDSILASVCFRAIYDEVDLDDYVVEVDEEFYQQMLFKPYIIKEIDDTGVDKSMLDCSCILCGEKAKKLSEWRFSGSSFHAIYKCEPCNQKYRVNVQFKRQYNQV